LREGKYEVRVFVEEFHLGTSNKTGSELESFAYFTVKPKVQTERVAQMPETNLLAVALTVLTVLLILKK